MSKSIDGTELPPHFQLELIKFASDLPLQNPNALANLAIYAFWTFLDCKSRAAAEIKSLKSNLRTLRRLSTQGRQIKLIKVKLVVLRRSQTPTRKKRDERLVPAEIKGYELRFNSLREQIRIESLLLERVTQIGGLPCLLQSTEQKLAWLQTMLNDTLAKASVWCYENRYNLHSEFSEAGVLQLWVTCAKVGG